jgi:hypothetical protein
LIPFYRGVSVPIWSRTELHQDLGVPRHPVTSQRSAEEHMARTVPGTALPDQPMSGIASWVETHCRILSCARNLPKLRHMRVEAKNVSNNGDPQ